MPASGFHLAGNPQDCADWVIGVAGLSCIYLTGDARAFRYRTMADHRTTGRPISRGSIRGGCGCSHALMRDQEKHVPAKAGMDSGFSSDHATS
jgi:hypothetical protein